MKIFRKERQSLRVEKIRASRAVFIDNDVQEVHITVKTDEGDILTLQLTARNARELLMQLGASYEAINPPLRNRWADGASQWNGMD